MPICPKRPSRGSGFRRGLGARTLRKRVAIDGFALLGREFVQGGAKQRGTVMLKSCLLGIAAGIRIVLVGDRRMDFASAGTATATQFVDGAPLRNDAKPRRERAARIVCLPGPVNGDQRLLHDIVDAAGTYSLPARHPLDVRYAVAQQCLVSGSVTRLSSNHPGTPSPVRVVEVTGFFRFHCRHSCGDLRSKSRHKPADTGSAGTTMRSPCKARFIEQRCVRHQR